MYNWFRRNLLAIGMFFLTSDGVSIFVGIIIRNSVLGICGVTLLIPIIGIFSILDKLISLESAFEQEYRLLCFASKETKKNYEKIIFKYESLYKKLDENGKQNLIEKVNCLLKPALEEAQKNKEKKEKIILQKKTEKQKTKLETLEQWYQKDKMVLQSISKKDQ